MPEAVSGVYEEWRTRNEQRRYPFADDASLVDSATGSRLPDSTFVDAMFYPINTVGTLYVSGISMLQGEVYVSDSAGLVATAAIDTGDLRLLSFYDAYGRCTGIMVPGTYFAELTTDMNFTQGSAPLSQACVNAQMYDCLSGILLPDGTLVSGDIVWEGEDGIRITTEYIDDVPVVRFDAIGTSDLPACLPLTPPIKCIKVAQTGTGGALMISQDENIISLATPYALQDFCGKFQVLPDSSGKLPLGKDACTVVPPEPCTPPEPHTGNCPALTYADYFVWAASDTLAVSLVQQDPIFSQQAVADQALADNGVSLPARPRQGIRISLKGADNA